MLPEIDKKEFDQITAIQLLAVRLAKLYLVKVKSINLEHRPWPPHLQVWQTRWWSSFCKCSVIVSKLKAKPEQYIIAQFDRWDGPKKTIPMPNQLVSDRAQQRYCSWFERWQFRNYHRKLYRDEVKQRLAVFEENKLLHYCECLGLPAEEVLKQECVGFSRGFLQKNGVWEEIADFWSSARGIEQEIAHE